MNRRGRLVLLAVNILLLAHISATAAQVPDGTVKITRRTISPGIGVEWGQGLLTYNGRDYAFSYRAGGTFRHVDTEMTAVELAGQVFNLKTLEDFSGRYHKVESEGPATGGGSRVTMKNQKGVVVNVVSPIEARKFDLTREGLDVELKLSH
jgi:outer membrane immunogenic protein